MNADTASTPSPAERLVASHPQCATEVLHELGVGRFELGGLRLSRRGPIDGEYIHHSKVPVAAVAYALIDPDGCRQRFPKLKLTDLVAMTSSMDYREYHALSVVCGVLPSEHVAPNAAKFGRQVWSVVDRYDLSDLFVRVGEGLAYGQEGDHYHLRPRGYDYLNNGGFCEADLVTWRKQYRDLEVSRQILTMSILYLYNSHPHSNWTNRLPRKWHAGEAVRILEAEGALGDWGRLIGYYSGW